MTKWTVLIAGLIATVLSPLAGSAQMRPGDGSGFVSGRSVILQPVLWQQQRRGPGPLGARGRPLPPPPPQLLERLSKLPPEERERVLENNRRFRQLSPAQQALLLKRLQQFQKLSSEQRELIEQRLAIFNNLTPRQQAKARRLYENVWSKLTAERRRALLEEFRQLRALHPPEREQRLASDDFQAHFNAEERDLLQQLIDL